MNDWQRPMSNSDRLPPLVICDRRRWQALWCGVAIALPVAMVVLTLITLWREVKGEWW